tara:strand:- start:14006 stop:14716 length:711 start_codon:yes stop_codon:yes gene_type:complete
MQIEFVQFGRAVGMSIGLAMSSLGGCASVPPETVELSLLIGQDLEELHRSHRALAVQHFKSIKDDINIFINQTYRPALIAETARNANLVPNVTAILDRDPSRLPAYLARFIEAVDPRVETKRAELLEPIERQEAQLLADIDAAHGQVLAANATISGHLASIRQVHEAQATALERAGLADLRERISVTVADVSARVAALNARGAAISGSIDDAAERVRELDEAISSVVNSDSEEVGP